MIEVSNQRHTYNDTAHTSEDMCGHADYAKTVVMTAHVIKIGLTLPYSHRQATTFLILAKI